MSSADNIPFGYLFDDPFDLIRAVEEIQRKIAKREKQNVFSRHIHARNDKEKIAAWRLDLTRILQVFNVRPIVYV